MKYNDDDCSQGSGQIVEAFRAQKKDDILKPYVSEHDFRSTNDDNDIGYKLYVFDIGCQKKIESAQPTKVVFKFSEKVPAGIYSYGLVLAKKINSISSDGQRHFDLI